MTTMIGFVYSLLCSDYVAIPCCAGFARVALRSSTESVRSAALWVQVLAIAVVAYYLSLIHI